MKKMWEPCFNKSGHCDPNMKTVLAFFEANFAKRPKCKNTPAEIKDKNMEMIKHIYGWVPFNEGCDNAALNALKDTPNYHKVHRIYRDLQTDKKGFNPYVDLIHGSEFLDMSAYAFSIDDAVGNMQEVGDGLIVSVGGPKGLPNGKRYDPKEVIMVTLGATEPSGPTWESFGACATDPAQGPCKTDMKIAKDALNFKIATFPFPYQITIKDSKGVIYQFFVKKAPPLTKADISGCLVNNKDNTWCVNINPNTQKDNLTGKDVYYISLASPAKVSGEGSTGICTGRVDNQGKVIPCCQPKAVPEQRCPPDGSKCPNCGSDNCECPTVQVIPEPGEGTGHKGNICTGKLNSQGNPIACCQPALGQKCPPRGTDCPTCGAANCECPE
jgi:hypothetical protein